MKERIKVLYRSSTGEDIRVFLRNNVTKLNTLGRMIRNNYDSTYIKETQESVAKFNDKCLEMGYTKEEIDQMQVTEKVIVNDAFEKHVYGVLPNRKEQYVDLTDRIGQPICSLDLVAVTLWDNFNSYLGVNTTLAVISEMKYDCSSALFYRLNGSKAKITTRVRSSFIKIDVKSMPQDVQEKYNKILEDVNTERREQRSFPW